MSDPIFNKDNKEYQSYGHYIINDRNFFSIKRFKDDHMIENNYPEQNSKEGEKLNQMFRIEKHKAEPEEGSHRFIYIYSEEQLIDFFEV